MILDVVRVVGVFKFSVLCFLDECMLKFDSEMVQWVCQIVIDMGYVWDVFVFFLWWGKMGMIGVIVLCLIDMVMVMFYELFVYVVVCFG